MKFVYGLLLLFTISCASHKAGRYIYLEKKADLKSIAKQYKISVNEIKSANPTTNLNPGNWLFIPYGGDVILNNRDIAHSSVTSASKIFTWPLPSSRKISSYYGKRGRRFHDGIDIPAPKGSHIISAANGTVLYTGRLSGYGKVVIINHQNGFYTVYAHVRKFFVRKSESVGGGQVIAQVGMTGRSSGPHLHFEVRYQNKIINPLPYLKWVPGSSLARR